MRPIYLIVLVLIQSAEPLLAQAAVPEELKRIQKQLKNQPVMSYEYVVEQKLEDGKINKATGKIIKGRDFYYESNPSRLTIQTEKWYYRLDHIGKTIFIVDLEKVRSKQKVAKTSPAGDLNLIPDSVLSKHGKFDIRDAGGISKIRVSFKEETLIRDIYIEYDDAKKVPVLYQVRMMVPYGVDGWNYEERFVDQAMTATGFSFSVDDEAGNLSPYFSFKNGKVQLKKYNHYKLIKHI